MREDSQAKSALLRAQRSVKLALNKLRADISSLSRCEFPGDHPGPKLWLGLLTGLLDTADERLKVSAAASLPPSEALENVSDANDLSLDVYNYLQLFQGATVDDLPYMVVPPMQSWLDTLRLENSTFFRTEMVANYEVRSFARSDFGDIRDPAASLVKAIEVVKWPFVRITLPSQAFSLVPHLAIVAHEIGHLLYASKGFDAMRAGAQDRALDRIAKKVSIKSTPDKLRGRIHTVYLNWYEEFCADAFAFHLTGPAVFFAFAELIQGSGHGVGETHPTNQARLKAMYDRLAKPGAGSFAAAFEKNTDVALRFDLNTVLVPNPPSKAEVRMNVLNWANDPELASICAELHAEFPRLVRDVYRTTEEYLRKIAPDALYTPAAFDADLREHLQPLLEAIPPIESGDVDSAKPASLVSILNVGWAALLTKIEHLKVKVDDNDPFHAERLEKLHDLLLKAIELSEARSSWHATPGTRP
ncbi:MAG: hypothetical protein NBV67_15215 [Tagaea sp.]|nr:hypothetical protein [Tagaea sp.]